MSTMHALFLSFFPYSSLSRNHQDSLHNDHNIPYILLSLNYIHLSSLDPAASLHHTERAFYLSWKRPGFRYTHFLLQIKSRSQRFHPKGELKMLRSVLRYLPLSLQDSNAKFFSAWLPNFDGCVTLIIFSPRHVTFKP